MPTVAADAYIAAAAFIDGDKEAMHKQRASVDSTGLAPQIAV